jgi:hypothetical protein
MSRTDKGGDRSPPAATNNGETTWEFSTRALVIWGLVAFLVGVIVGDLLMLTAAYMALGSCR